MPTVNKLQSSHIDLRIQGDPEQSPDKEDQEETSYIKVLVKHVLESPNKNQVTAELFLQNEEKEHQDISDDFNNVVKEHAMSKTMKCS